MDALGIIVSAFIAILMAPFVNHFLHKSRDERKERIDAVNKNIEQVQSYLNDYFDAANLVIDLETKVVTMDSIVDAPTVLDKIQELVNQTTKKMHYIPLLKDLELINFEKEWIITFWTEHKKLLDLITDVSKEQPINRAGELSRIALFNGKTAFLFGRMRSRLDELAQSIK